MIEVVRYRSVGNWSVSQPSMRSPRLASTLPSIPADDATITLHYDEFAHSLGTRPPRLTRSLQRLNAFHLAHTLPEQPTTLYIRRRVPTLNTRQLARLAEHCPTLAAHHDQLLHTAASPTRDHVTDAAGKPGGINASAPPLRPHQPIGNG